MARTKSESVPKIRTFFFLLVTHKTAPRSSLSRSRTNTEGHREKTNSIKNRQSEQPTSEQTMTKQHAHPLPKYWRGIAAPFGSSTGGGPQTQGQGRWCCHGVVNWEASVD